jgi:hypothetical protein
MVNDRIIAANCPAHILHNATKKVADKMEVDVEDLVKNIQSCQFFSQAYCSFKVGICISRQW